MKKLLITGTALRSGFVAPTLGGALAGVCPQGGLAVDVHAVNFSRDRQVTVPSAGTAAAAMGHRSWSPPIT